MFPKRPDTAPTYTNGSTRHKLIVLEATSDDQNKKDDDQNTDHANPAMPEAVAVAAEAATKAPEKKYDEKNQKNGTKRHNVLSFGRILPVC